MKCEAMGEFWGPQEGCREFMDAPEATWECGNDAAVMIVENYDGEYGLVALCEEHAPSAQALNEEWEQGLILWANKLSLWVTDQEAMWRKAEQAAGANRGGEPWDIA